MVGSVGLPAKYGGWETLVDYLTQALFGDYDITVYCSKKRYTEQRESYNGVKLSYVNLDANGVQSILYDIVSLWRAVRNSDTILVLGVSGCIALPFFRIFSRCKFVVNIDGLEWKRDKWGKAAKLFLWLSEFVAVKSAHVVIADNVAIQKYIRAKYNVESVYIPYGADHVLSAPPSIESREVRQRHYAFKVCRIEPENNIHVILSAFSKQSLFDLKIVGNWKNSRYGQKLYADFNGLPRIQLLDPVYDLAELNNLRGHCAFYVHGHSAGGTNPSLVEAMHLGLPIVAKNVNYNVSTTGGAAVYFDSEQELTDVITNLRPQSLKTIGEAMKTIAMDKYTWAKVAEAYSVLF
jgi:glycosyltransferase involved in cell wall biosynthesis